jgi:hypothetical protein
MGILELENRCTGNRTVGSNPTLSAIFCKRACQLKNIPVMGAWWSRAAGAEPSLLRWSGVGHDGVKLCLQAFSHWLPHRHSLGPPSTSTSPSSQPVSNLTTRLSCRNGTKLRAQLRHAGKSRDPVRDSRLGGCVADKRLALGCRRRADPCQLALYAYCRHADEQEIRGSRPRSGRTEFTNDDRNLGTIACNQNEPRHCCHARLSVGTQLKVQNARACDLSRASVADLRVGHVVAPSGPFD